MKKSLFVVGLISTIAIVTTAFLLDIRFERNVGGHLKLAADANSVELAEQRLERAIQGMDHLRLCNNFEQKDVECFTSVVYNTPDEDVAYWRTNLDKTLEDLREVPENADHLTVSNTLLKVRETLLDSGNEGEKVTVPHGISRYPHNFLFGLGTILSVLISLIGLGFDALRLILKSIFVD